MPKVATPAPIKRIYRTRITPVVATDKNVLAKATRLLANINVADEQIAMIARRRAEEITKLEKFMTEEKLQSVSEGDTLAHFKHIVGNKSTVIDISKLRKALPKDKEFFDTVKPVIGKLKKYLTEPEIARISEEIPGEDKGIQFVIEPITKR